MNQKIKDGSEYFTYFMNFMGCFLVFVFFLTVLMDGGPDAKTKERRKWCDEAKPKGVSRVYQKAFDFFAEPQNGATKFKT